MALGYSIATILKRSSHIVCDDRVCVKTDWLEQLNRKYVQVLSSINILWFRVFASLVGLSSILLVQILVFTLHYHIVACL